MKIVQAITRDNTRLSGQLDELAAHRRSEDRRPSSSYSSSTGRCPDWVVIPGGNLGNVSALGARLPDDARARPHPAAAADRRGAGRERQPALSRVSQAASRDYEPVAAKTTLASAIQIGDPVSFKQAVRALQQFDGVVEQASEQELADAAARADRTGCSIVPHTGVALAALEKLVDRGVIAESSSRRRHLDRAWSQVRRPEGRVQHGATRRGAAELAELARRASRRRRARQESDPRLRGSAGCRVTGYCLPCARAGGGASGIANSLEPTVLPLQSAT